MTIIERVARAMWLYKEGKTPPPRVSWENALPDEREFMLEAARAAIEAMREPTEEMRQAGVHEHALTASPEDMDQVSAPYTAMIDRALKPDGT